MKIYLNRVLILGLALLPPMAVATDEPAFRLTLKDHCFQPAELTVPADAKLTTPLAIEQPVLVPSREMATAKPDVAVAVGVYVEPTTSYDRLLLHVM